MYLRRQKQLLLLLIVLVATSFSTIIFERFFRYSKYSIPLKSKQQKEKKKDDKKLSPVSVKYVDLIRVDEVPHFEEIVIRPTSHVGEYR